MSTINTSSLSDHLPPALTADHLHSMKTSEPKAQQSLVCGIAVPAGCVLLRIVYVNGRAELPHSHLPAGIVATMRRVVKYHSSWERQQQVELFDASGNPGSTAGRGFNPAGGAPGGG
ncbi:hypothetical protein F511_43214 [Dorcoceras hygrometricum]|uniref:Uncharacterized protein n=1 Tax=Dorcoceras hygrometricum TaxID=472368 RepID=A0A2Z7D3G3_9LAMI|nr:hypothetical protein F511_43214 [Dorcoceras hygrometricum]